MAQFQFQTDSVEKRENNFELLPAGWYKAQVTESDLVPLNSGKGTALKLTFEIIDNPPGMNGVRGRKVWARLNVRHENGEAERIANQHLRELCEAAGLARMQDTVELHNKPIEIKVKVRKSDDPRYEDQNEVNAYRPIGAGPGQAPAPGGFARPPAAQPPVQGPAQPPASAQPPAPAPAPAGAPTPPWQRRAA